jgi:hypothetical protein
MQKPSEEQSTPSLDPFGQLIHRQHAANTLFCTTRLFSRALLLLLLSQQQNDDNKPRSAGIIMPIASYEGPRYTPSLSLDVPTTTRTISSVGCSYATPRRQKGPTHRGMSRPLAHPATGGRMSRLQSLSALSRSVHLRQLVDPWLRASLSLPHAPIRSWGPLEVQHKHVPSTAD